MGHKRTKREVVEEYLKGGVSLRELEAKFGVPRQTIHRWAKGSEAGLGDDKQESLEERRKLAAKQSEDLPGDVRRLQKELEEARLYNELLNTMIDIAEDQLGVDIRKKRGAKRQ
jgi:transposase